MAVTIYASQSELEEYLLGSGKAQATQQGNFDAALEAASRLIDQYTGRRFWKDDAATARQFTAKPDEVYLDDVADVAGLLFKTDENFDGVYETLWAIDSFTGAGFRLWPTNAQTDPDIIHPYTRARAIGTSFPSWELAVEVTAVWGYPAVPTDIHMACLLQAARLWKRKDAVLGLGGAAETGFFELRRRMDPDVRRLIDPYRRFTMTLVP